MAFRITVLVVIALAATDLAMKAYCWGATVGGVPTGIPVSTKDSIATFYYRGIGDAVDHMRLCMLVALIAISSFEFARGVYTPRPLSRWIGPLIAWATLAGSFLIRPHLCFNKWVVVSHQL